MKVEIGTVFLKLKNEQHLISSCFYFGFRVLSILGCEHPLSKGMQYVNGFLFKIPGPAFCGDKSK